MLKVVLQKTLIAGEERMDYSARTVYETLARDELQRLNLSLLGPNLAGRDLVWFCVEL
jgi:hypothetical protein